MIAQWILQVLAGTIVGCVIGYFLLRIFTKIRVFLFRKRSNRFKAREEIEKFHIKRFYDTFGFQYEDLIKYAPELDEFLSSKLHSGLKDSFAFKMIKMHEIYDAINTVEQIDIIKFKQTIENIKNQKFLENIE